MIPLRSNASLLPFLEKEENSSLRTLLSVVSYEITPPWNMLDEDFTESVYLLGGTYGSWLYNEEEKIVLVSLGSCLRKKYWNSIYLCRKYGSSWSSDYQIQLPRGGKTAGEFLKDDIRKFYASKARNIIRKVSHFSDSYDSMFHAMNSIYKMW